ncbi:hypothetical protein EZV62_010519 [Acer yangbiense]|uniref:Cation/H+ exchanger transmembrane domain-containing protein n=1 Tax=Acer yangbiense TaxID=1000413 RepID=A0A5C7I340_9ROSI|nr:hypothetical protein EZV62_010519 [Acer yangbiense]
MCSLCFNYLRILTLSATDSVCTLQVLNQEETPLLYSLVFGEGVVNDVTSVVLCNVGLLSAYMMKNLCFGSPWKSIGVSLILLGLILVGRVASVFPLSCLSNLPKKLQNGGLGSYEVLYLLHLRTVRIFPYERFNLEYSLLKNIVFRVILFRYENTPEMLILECDDFQVFGLLTMTFVRLMMLPQ